jgi:CrcB protein
MIFNLFNLPLLGEFFGVLTQNQELIKPLAVSLGAVPGALSRYYITIWLAQWLGNRFPFGTFVINLSGALLMGFVASLALEQVISSPQLQIFTIHGFVASYTTFSTFTLDIATLLRIGSWKKALGYGVGSIVLGGICLEIGIFGAKMLSEN